MKGFKSYYIVLLIFATCLSTAHAQYFGKNKVQYTNFKWQYLQSEHFDIYFTNGGKDLAAFTARVAEESYRSMQKAFRYTLTDRIRIIVHNSHNDFQQTNIDLSEPEESVGGFTEFFKNRVVIPYEGEWEAFRHVIHHEVTHAVMLQMVYGSGVQSIITGMTQMQLPLWFIEGLAEFESRGGWDIESDMFMRDATVNGYLPEIPFLSAFLAYKGGQSVWRYISDRYGEEKVGELLGKVKINKNFDRGLKQSIGIETEELTKRWQLYLKRQYWPDVENRKEPEEFAKRLTDHRKDGSFINNSPSINHKGDKLAYKSDRSDYFDIYLMSAIDGRILKKLVRGQRAGNLEELQWLRGPGISWSPDDKRLVFTAKAGGQDALYIVNIKKNKIEKSHQFGLDGVYNPSWNPKGDEIAFTGLKNGHCDIYAFNLKTQNLRKITDDIFSDLEPNWSPDGKKLVFISDRGDMQSETLLADFSPTQINMKNFDIFEINSDGSGLQHLVRNDFSERTPVYSPDGKFIAFSSERAGLSNIYLKNLESNEEYPVTNVLAGAFQPSWGGSADRLAFTSFYYAGYDLYLLKNPLGIKPGSVIVNETQFLQKLRESKSNKELVAAAIDVKKSALDEENQPYRDFVFDENFAEGKKKEKEEEVKVALDSSEYKLPTGEFIVHKYKVKLTTDLVYGNLGYSQFFGTQGMTNIMMSDVLGNHRLNVALNIFGDFRNSDYALTYFYLPMKLDIGAGLFHNAYYFYSGAGWIRDRNYGLILYLSNPFNKFERVSYGVTAMGINRSYLELPDDVVDSAIAAGYLPPRDRYIMLNNLSYTRDTSVWGFTGPINGNGTEVGITYSPGLGKNGIDFATLRGDWRRYFRIVRDYTFAFRLAGGLSEGRNKQKFFLGGVPNWLNQDFYEKIEVDKIEDIYFASFEMPLRGADYWELAGNRFVLSNLEFRFPLVRRLQMGFPLPLDLWNIGGALFADLGLAWDKGNKVKPVVKSPNGLLETRDLFASIGFGSRIYLGIFLLRFDLAWPTTLYKTEKSPHIIWSLGADF